MANLKENLKKGKEKAKNLDFKEALKFIYNPYEAYTTYEKDLSDNKNCFIVSGVIVLFATIVNLIVRMYHAVKVTSFSWLAGETTTKWVWENLGKLNYFKIIGTNILVYAGILAAISGVYYLATLIIKKEISFVKLLSIVNITIIPYILGSLIIAPLLGMISSYIYVGAIVIAFILSIASFIELINERIVIDDKSKKIYFHLICLSVLIIVAYIVAVKSITKVDTISALNLFK